MRLPTSLPAAWNSAFRPIVYEYDFDYLFAGASSDGGYLKFTTTGTFDFLPVVGEQLFVSGAAAYSGLHTIREVVASNVFITDTIYTGGGGGFLVYHIRLPDVEIYVGYDTGESYETELPLTLIGTIMTERTPDNTIRFDVSGYLQSYFENIGIAEIGGEIDFSLFNRFRIKFDDVYRDRFHVLFSTITHDELNEKFVNTGRYLCAEYPPLQFTCGTNILTRIMNDAVMTTTFDDGPDFDPTDFDPTDFE